MGLDKNREVHIINESGFSLPAYATEGSAGLDLRAWLPKKGTESIVPGARALISTKIRLALPAGYEAQVRSRSSLALHHGVTVLNAPGTIDSDYRGEIKIILINLGDVPFSLSHGDRIAQLVVAPYIQTRFKLAEDLPASMRGAGGFGSTGRS